MNSIRQRLRRLRTSDARHVRVLEQIEDEWHVQTVLGHATDGRRPGEVVPPGRRGLTAQVQPIDDPAPKHHVAEVLTDDIGRMLIRQCGSEALRGLGSKTDLLEQRFDAVVLEKVPVG